MGEAVVEVGRLAGICGHDGSVWVKLRVDASGYLRMVVESGSMTVLPGTGEKLIGLSGIVEELLSDTSLDAGANNLDGTAVPSGEMHVITHAYIQYVGTVPDRVQIQAVGLADTMIFFNQEDPVSLMPYPVQLGVVLQGGDKMRGTVEGATAGNNLYFRYCGYKFAAP